MNGDTVGQRVNARRRCSRRTHPSAYCYSENADTAIAEFSKGLAYDPKKADILFNPGIVKWQGRKDGPGAAAACKKLLETSPACPNKDAVLQLIAQAQQH